MNNEKPAVSLAQGTPELSADESSIPRHRSAFDLPRVSVNFQPSGSPLHRAARDRIIARLEFYASERISPVVTTCSVITRIWSSADFAPESPQSAPSNLEKIASMSEEIIRALFRAFRRFGSLRSVSIDRTDGSAFMQLDSKTALNLATPIDLILASLTVYHQVDRAREYDTQAVELLSLLCYDATKLRVEWDEKTDNVFVKALTGMGPFPHLRKLTIFPRSLEQAPLFEGLLALCPALEDLIVLWDFNNIDRLEDEVPLTLEPDTPYLVQERNSMRMAIEEHERIVSLDLRVHNLTADFLENVCECFPNLRALAVWAREYDPSEEGPHGNSEILYSALCMPGPHLQALEFLTVCLDNEYELLEPEDESSAMDVVDPSSAPKPKGKYIETVFEDEVSGWDFPSIPLLKDHEALRFSKDYTIGDDGVFWDINSPLFRTFDWAKLEKLEQFERLQFLRIEGMNWPNSFSFEADRRRPQGEARSIEEWRESFERQYRL
ncbi:hypothetical protein B0H13DRAFT_1902382 [Mycena leptocephala]|nr:hypothetical protein B0H13DRAFT_1902382 [Mycena leptocephala]